MPRIIQLSTMHGQLRVGITGSPSIKIMCASMYHLAAYYSRRMVGSPTVQVQPLGVKYGMAFSLLPVAKPVLLLLHGQFLMLPRSKVVTGITMILFRGRQVPSGRCTCK